MFGKINIVKQGKAMLEMYKQGYLECYMNQNKKLRSKTKAWKEVSDECVESFGKLMMKGGKKK